MKTSKISLFFCTIAVLMIAAGCETSGTQRAEQFEKEVLEMHKRTVMASTEINKTLAAMNGLTSESVDLPAQFKAYGEQVKKVESGMKESRKRKNSMMKSGDAQMASWKEKIETIENEKMKQRSLERYDKVITEREEIRKLVTEIDNHADPFITGLNDIKTYLDVDLSPSSVASIADLMNSSNKMGMKIKGNLDKLADVLEKVLAKAEQQPEQ